MYFMRLDKYCLVPPKPDPSLGLYISSGFNGYSVAINNVRSMKIIN